MDSFPTPVLAAAADVIKHVDGDDSLPILWTCLYHFRCQFCYLSLTLTLQSSPSSRSRFRTATDSRTYPGAFGISPWLPQIFLSLVTFWNPLRMHTHSFSTRLHIGRSPPTNCLAVPSLLIARRCLRMVRAFFTSIDCFQQFRGCISHFLICIYQLFSSDLRYNKSPTHTASRRAKHRLVISRIVPPELLFS